MQHRIAILVETTHASARETLRGVAAFVRDSGADWAIDHEPQRLETGAPDWFRRWRGDGIIARLHCRRTAEAVARTGRPAVDVIGVARQAARLLADRLAGRGRPHRGRRAAVTLPPLGVVLRRSTDCLAINDAEVVAALRLIRSRAHGRLTIEEVAAEVGTSRSTLVRRFRALVGHGVHDEIMQVRVREAQRLLAESDLTILAIARQCGFEYQEHLGRVFRQRLGISPARYRRTARQPRTVPGMIPAG
jgi:transcriptional regulator GlxA family with amidase domain